VDDDRCPAPDGRHRARDVGNISGAYVTSKAAPLFLVQELTGNFPYLERALKIQSVTEDLPHSAES
jgi:hypothetical protein